MKPTSQFITGWYLQYGITQYHLQPKWTHPALIPARQTGTRFTYSSGMKGWFDLGDWLPTSQMVSHPSINWAVQSRELNSQPVDLTSNVLTTSKPNPDPPEDQSHQISSKSHLKRWRLRYKKKHKINMSCDMDSLQRCSFTPSCQSICILRLVIPVNIFWKMLHVNQVPSLCDFSRCASSWLGHVKPSEQCLHEYGFAPVWV